MQILPHLVAFFATPRGRCCHSRNHLFFKKKCVKLCTFKNNAYLCISNDLELAATAIRREDMRTSTYLLSDAINEVKEFLSDKGQEWAKGQNYAGEYSVEERSADCSAFPCPCELDDWSGEIPAIYVYLGNEEVFAVAYWSEDEENIESLLEGACGDSAIGNIKLSILDRDDEVTLYKVEGENFITACLQYLDEPTAIFIPDDWQGYYPETIADLEDVSWLYYNGDRYCSAVMLNGKPRVL